MDARPDDVIVLVTLGCCGRPQPCTVALSLRPETAPPGHAVGRRDRDRPRVRPRRGGARRARASRPSRGRPAARAWCASPPRTTRVRRRQQAREREAFRIALLKIRERGLAMKLTRVEQLYDGSRLVFYFTADGRVDFRELVRELAAEFRTRIEMRQIGVRDEARMIGGYGSCGRPLCCTAWLQSFEPVSIKMAKQQDLSLNPSKLSGLCGRLKCCLRYELPEGKLPRKCGVRDEVARPRPRRLPPQQSDPCRCFPALRSPSATRPASAPNWSRRPCATRACSPCASRSSTARPTRRVFAPGVLSAAGGARRLRRARARRRRRARRPRGGDRDRADQQGGVGAGRTAVARPHRAARAPDRGAARRHDVLLAPAPRRSRERPCGARRGAAGPDIRPHGRPHPADGARAAAVRLRASASGAGRPEPARGRARPDRPRGRRRSCGRRSTRAAPRASRGRAVSGRHAVCSRRARRVRRRRRLLPRPGAGARSSWWRSARRSTSRSACRSSGRRSTTARRSTSRATGIADAGQPGRSGAAGREAGGGAARVGEQVRHGREDRAPEGGEERRREPEGVPRLPHPRDVRGGRGAARHRGEGDPRGAREPARQLTPASRTARCSC